MGNYKNNMKDQWNANLYDEKHSFVSLFGSDLVELLAPQKGEHILDIGCGTGDLANKLHDLHVDVLGIDNSPNMIQQAKGKYPHLHFLVDDVTDLKYKNDFDAIFSNATLHWVKKPKQALQCIYNSLKTKGRFVAEFGGKGNVQQITDEIINQFNSLGIEFTPDRFPWNFPSIGEYSTLMEEVGFRVTFAHHFDRPTPLEGANGLSNWIVMFGSSMFEGIPDNIKTQIITNAENNLKDRLFENGTWVADYKRIRVVGIKE